jgi:hypothetical protein
MVTWTPAPCGVALSKELDEVYGAERPNDGTIGDLAHSARASDHNPKQPRPPGWVDARDIYDWRNPKTGLALEADILMHALAAGRDRRILYVISHGRMCSSYQAGDIPAWTWRPYSGPNGHFTHGHISFRPEHRHDRSTWLTAAVRAALGLALPDPTPVTPLPVPEGPMYQLLETVDTKRLYAYAPGEIRHIPSPDAFFDMCALESFPAQTAPDGKVSSNDVFQVQIDRTAAMLRDVRNEAAR